MNDGGPAYPVTRKERRSSLDSPSFVADVHYSGMSLRDWFAGQAMRHLPTWVRSMSSYISNTGQETPDITIAHEHLPRFAELSYEMADALLAERAKRGGE